MPATYEPISSTTLGSAAATITMSSIPSTYTDLRIVLNGITLTSAGTYVSFRINGDTGTNYSYTKIYGTGASALSSRGTSTATLYLNDADASGANPYLIEVDIFSYAGSTNKTLLASSSLDRNGGGLTDRTVGLWRNTAAINSITFVSIAGNNFQSGTTATLYGIKAA